MPEQIGLPKQVAKPFDAVGDFARVDGSPASIQVGVADIALGFLCLGRCGWSARERGGDHEGRTLRAEARSAFSTSLRICLGVLGLETFVSCTDRISPDCGQRWPPG